MRERTYRARLCLVQIAIPDQIFLIDPLQGADLEPLARLIADPGVTKVVHAGRQDLELFYEMFELVPSAIFDVQVAAGFAGFGASLPYGVLVKSVVGVSLQKGEAYSDWCRRPLTEAQKRYAADDVRWLLEAADKLRAKLESLNRLDWALEEMAAFESDSTYATDSGESWRKVSGRGGLSTRQMGVLKELARWREDTAARRDLPRGWIVKDPTLVEIARRQPSNPGQLGGIRGLNKKEAERSAREILDAVSAGREQTIEPEPQAPPRSILVRARLISGMADAVVRARCERAGIATELVSTRSELESLLAYVLQGKDAEAAADRYRLLRGWRRELAGEAVLALARGEIAVRVSDKPPYVEEVRPDGG
jgi:ribonuclease D